VWQLPAQIMLALTIPSLCLASSSADSILKKAIDAYQIRPLAELLERPMGAKERLGQALFFDPVLSGPKSIACATCHARSLASADGLPMGVGLGARGVGSKRLDSEDAFIVPRNVFPFFERGSDDFRAFFWDGRVQIGRDGGFESPLGERLPDGFENLLAVAAVFPPVEPDEMLGYSPERGAAGKYHAELVTPGVNEDDFQARAASVFENLVDRLLGPSGEVKDETVAQYRELFSAAYPDTPLADLRIAHVGNALSAYISAAFALSPSAWDKYVAGDLSALSQEQKEGAVIFLGKGRCIVCHRGTQFSDFKFHGLAIPQLRVGKHGNHIDYGRAAATGRGADRFRFRTPPLRNVTKTAPYGHNGIFASLRAVIEHHINPIPALYAAQQRNPREASNAGRLLGFRSPILAEIAPLSQDDVKLLEAFLHSLSSQPVMPDSTAIPDEVPSGNLEFVRQQ
jgi:cytochrome c peroxidase